MRPNRWVIGAGLVGIVGLGTGCRDNKVREYLGEDGPMYKWQSVVREELCLLERYSTVPDAERRCKEPPSITQPPSYPPK